MRIPPNWPMEVLLACALGAVVVVIIFAIQDPPGDRTRYTLEQSQRPQVSLRRAPPDVEETALGR
jgi:hypothetical protein